MTELETAVRRIKLALKLATSPNANEAANALRKAQQWMEKYNLTQSDIDATDISQTEAPANIKKNPAQWETNLAWTCAKAFACELLFAEGFGKSHRGRWLFIGAETSHQLAAYAFSVLLKQLKKARTDYHASLSKNCKPTTKTARANVYATAWVAGVESVVQALQPSQRTSDAIAAYKAKNCTISPKASRQIKKLPSGSAEAALAGLSSGRKAQLHKPMTNTTPATALLN
jgi:hypothetical protein